MMSGPGMEPFEVVAARLSDWLRRELPLWRYKPGVRLEAVTRYGAMPIIRVTTRVMDARSAPTCGEMMDSVGEREWWLAPMRRPMTVVGVFLYPSALDLVSVQAFGAWLRKALGLLEEHERDEWLCRDGVRVFDPHGDGRQGVPDGPQGSEDG